MINLFHKIKSKTAAVIFITIAGGYFFGKKFIKYLNDYGMKNIEPLTDEEIKDTLGIGAGDGNTGK